MSRRMHSFFLVLALIVAAVSHTALSAPQAPQSPNASPDAAEPATRPPSGPAPSQPAEAKPAPAGPDETPQLGKEMAAFRDRIRRTFGRYYEQRVNTDVNTAGDVILFCLAFGCEAEVRHGAGKINGIGCLCWNYPCGGYRVLRAGATGIVPRVGYGLQSQPSQLLAVLGQTSVPQSYELRVGQHRGTVADLVDYEKTTCQSGTDQSLKLLGLACYVRDEETWKNEAGEEWSLERLLEEELKRSVATDDPAVTNHLLGLSYALKSREKSQRPVDGHFARARKFIEDFQRHALSLQNGNGSWHPRFFAARGESRDAMASLRSTGHIVHWLAVSLPDRDLETEPVLRAVNYLDNQLSAQISRWNATSSPPLATDAIAHALAALTTYDHRIFQPHDTPPQTSENPATAKKEK